MLLLKRLLTSAVLFVLFVLLFFVLAVVAGFLEVTISRKMAAAEGLTLENSFEHRNKIKQEFTERYGKTIIYSAVGLSFVASIAISFSRVFPWCRKKIQPPPIL